jgi:hypothetical protein
MLPIRYQTGLTKIKICDSLITSSEEDLMKLEDGTYLYQNGRMIPIQVSDGYWVAERELSPSELQSGMVVGVWTDTATGKVWLDKTRLHRSLTKATMYATLYNQIAIWDNSKQEEIRIG